MCIFLHPISKLEETMISISIKLSKTTKSHPYTKGDQIKILTKRNLEP